jgi:hypothetical protein
VRNLDVREVTYRAFNDEMQRRLQHTVWNAGCTSWYKTESGRITNNWPGSTFEYQRRTAELRLSDFVVHRVPVHLGEPVAEPVGAG